MRRALLAALAVLAASVVLGPAAPADAAPHQAAAATPDITCPVDYPGALKRRYYSASGTETTASGSYSVHVSVTVRDPNHCSGLIDEADGALRGYDDGNPAVGNVQVETPTLWANCPGSPCVQATSNMISNSNGGPSTSVVYTPRICVSPLGSGQYSSNGWFTWRVNGVLKEVVPQSNWTSANYATVAC